MEQQKLHDAHSCVGNTKLEDSLAVSYKAKDSLSIQFCNHASWYLPKWVENLCPHQNLVHDVYSSFIHSCQNYKQPKWYLLRGEWINKLVHPYIKKYYRTVTTNGQATERHSSFQLLSWFCLFATPWTAAYQASLSITDSQSVLKLIFIELVMPSNHLILCPPLFLLPSFFPKIRVFSSGVRITPEEGNSNPRQVFLPGNFHGQKSLAGYNPWGLKSQTMT